MQKDLDEQLKETIKAMTNEELSNALGFHMHHITALLEEVDRRLERLGRFSIGSF